MGAASVDAKLSIKLTDQEADLLVGGWLPDKRPYAEHPAINELPTSMRRSPTFWLRTFADYPRLLTEDELKPLPNGAKIAHSVVAHAIAGVPQARQIIFERIDGKMVETLEQEVTVKINRRAKWLP